MIENPSANKTVVIREGMGLTASTACVVHCIAVPWLATLSAVGSMLPRLHVILAIASLLFALPLFHSAIVRLVSRWVGVLALCGCVFLFSGLIFETKEEPLTIIGGCMLFCSHAANLYYHRRRHRKAKRSCCDCSHKDK